MDRARDALTSLDEALTLAREAGRRELVGALRVGVNPLLRRPVRGQRSSSTLPAAVPACSSRGAEELSGPLIEELQARRIDAALAFCPAYDDGLSYEPIATLSWWCSSARTIGLRGAPDQSGAAARRAATAAQRRGCSRTAAALRRATRGLWIRAAVLAAGDRSRRAHGCRAGGARGAVDLALLHRNHAHRGRVARARPTAAPEL